MSNFFSTFRSIEQYPGLVSFPVTGNQIVLYIDTNTNTSYYWNGSAYIALGSAGAGAVEQYPDLVSFPAVGSDSILYYAVRNNQFYIWNVSEASYFPVARFKYGVYIYYNPANNFSSDLSENIGIQFLGYGSLANMLNTGYQFLKFPDFTSFSQAFNSDIEATSGFWSLAENVGLDLNLNGNDFNGSNLQILSAGNSDIRINNAGVVNLNQCNINATNLVIRNVDSLVISDCRGLKVENLTLDNITSVFIESSPIRSIEINTFNCFNVDSLLISCLDESNFKVDFFDIFNSVVKPSNTIRLTGQFLNLNNSYFSGEGILILDYLKIKSDNRYLVYLQNGVFLSNLKINCNEVQAVGILYRDASIINIQLDIILNIKNGYFTNGNVTEGIIENSSQSGVGTINIYVYASAFYNPFLGFFINNGLIGSDAIFVFAYGCYTNLLNQSSSPIIPLGTYLQDSNIKVLT